MGKMSIVSAVFTKPTRNMKKPHLLIQQVRQKCTLCYIVSTR